MPTLQLHLIAADAPHSEMVRRAFLLAYQLPRVSDGSEVFLIDLTHPEAAGHQPGQALHNLYATAQWVVVTAQPMVASTLPVAVCNPVGDIVQRGRVGHSPSFSPEGSSPCATAGVAPTIVSTRVTSWNPEKSKVAGATLTLDAQHGQVKVGQRTISLTVLEFKLLDYLAQQAGRVVSQAELLRAIWQSCPQTGGSESALKSLIKRLRRKIEPDPQRPRYLRTVQGRGYYLLVQAELEPIAG